MRRHVVASTGILALGLALVGIGCGGDDAPTKSEYIADADAICKQGDKEIEAAGEEAFGNQPPTEAEATAFVEDTVVPNTQNQIDELRELTPPDGDEDTVEGIYDDAQAALDEVEQDPSAVASGGNPFAEVNEDARAYGLKACGSDE